MKGLVLALGYKDNKDMVLVTLALSILSSQRKAFHLAN